MRDRRQADDDEPRRRDRRRRGGDEDENPRRWQAESQSDRSRSLTIRGIVSACEWHDDSSVSRVSILTFDEDEFEVDPDGVGGHLREHLRSEVLVRGRLLDQFRKRKVVRVKSFSVIPPE